MALEMVALAREPDFRLGRCVVSPSAGLLTAPGGGQARLEPRVMQVLVALARRAGHPVSRDDLLHACWGNVVVGDDALNRCIQRLRAAFRDLAEPGIQIETLPRLGYRLRLPDGLSVEPLQPPPPAAAPPGPAPSPSPPPQSRRPWLPLALAGRRRCWAGWWYWRPCCSGATPARVGRCAASPLPPPCRGGRPGPPCPPTAASSPSPPASPTRATPTSTCRASPAAAPSA
ncbi:winged helix-turn-helix domain-containing protein [Aerophototrophica crusticola]|uniref:winged helix-turn-helix domain-containing protein n=1 Tax=Aerophototrophica crusticola TaxID=1709002 RepID=UPI00384A9B69